MKLLHRFAFASLTGLSAAAVTALVMSSGCVSSRPYGLELPPDVLEEFRSSRIEQPVGPVNVDAAISIAIRNDSTLAVLRENVAVAKALRRNTVRIADPEFRMNYGGESSQANQANGVPVTGIDGEPTTLPINAQTTETGSGDLYGFALRFIPPNPWVLKHEVSAADADVFVAGAELRAAEWQAAMAVRLAYENAVYLRDDVAEFEKLVSVYKEVKDALESRASQGAATLGDVLIASGKYLTAVSDRDDAARSYAQAVEDLAQLMGTPDPRIALSERPPLSTVTPAALDQARLEAVAIRYRADFIALAWKVQGAAAAISVARAADIPWFSYLQGSVGGVSRQTMPASGTGVTGAGTAVQEPNLASDMTRDQWQVDTGIVLPLFSLMQDDTAPQEAEYRRAKTELSGSWRKMMASIVRRSERLTMAAENLRKFEADVQPHVDKMRELLQTMEQQGGTVVEDVARIRDAVISMERTRLRTDFEYRVSILSLMEALGRDLDFAAEKPAPADPEM